MSPLTLLLLLAIPYIRIPDKTALPNLPDGPVWVHFTDKGIFNEQSLNAALSVHSRAVSPLTSTRRLLTVHTRADFADLPIRDAYIRTIERLGGRLRHKSNWLNAASFDLPTSARAAVYRLPFVYAIEPVRSGTTSEPIPVRLNKDSLIATYRLDTSAARRFYGPSYDQAQLMGVPEVFFRGHFGAGVRLAIFDTGLRLTHQAVSRMRIWKQYDFLSGDNAFVCRSADGWSALPVANIAGYGLVHSPALLAHPRAAGSDTTVLTLLFVADSFDYTRGQPARAIFASLSYDHGYSWTNPQPILRTARPWDVTYQDLFGCHNRNVGYLAYVELTANSSGPATTTINLGLLVNGVWQHSPGYVAAGRNPALAVQRDTLYLAYVKQDSMLALRRYNVAGTQPSWLVPEVTLNAGEPLASTSVIAAAGRLDAFARGRTTGRLLCWHSEDGGQTFGTARVLLDSAVQEFATLATGDTHLICYTAFAGPPFTHLACLLSTDGGQTWTHATPIVDSVLTIGSFSALFESGTVSVFCEIAGHIYRVTSSDLGTSWTSSASLDSSGFCYLPASASTADFAIATWFKRGDGNAVWEDSDNLRFSWEQPHHGTRMASIIAGYDPHGIIGIAPGVDLLIAKTELYKTRSGHYYEYNMEEDTYIEALEWAEACGADIVSTSLGYHGWYGDEQLDGRTAPVSIAAEMAARRGLIIVAAMGNRDTTLYRWPRPFITAPGDAEHVITAGGIQSNGAMWRLTGSGPTADGRIKPDLVALSDVVTVAAPDSVSALEGSSGTSCATALIAGACALVKEIRPDWNSDSVRAVLFATATRTVKSCTFGFGVPRVDSIYKLYPPGPDNPDVTGDRISLVYPNPFVLGQHSRVYFALDLTQPAPLPASPAAASPASISIYSASGTLIKELPLNTVPLGRPGHYGSNGDTEMLETIGAFWDGQNTARRPVAAGIYVAVLHTTFGRSVTRFAVVR